MGTKVSPQFFKQTKDPYLPKVTEFFDLKTNVHIRGRRYKTRACAIIDSVLDLDYASGTVSYENADGIIKFIKDKMLNVEWILETHIHADHLSAAPYLREALGGKLAIGEHVTTIQRNLAHF